MTLAELTRLNALKEKYINSDNKACFIERERVLRDFESNLPSCTTDYARILAVILDKASTPIDFNDVFAGRMVEAIPDPGMTAPNNTVMAVPGHLCLEWTRVLGQGIWGILQDVEQRAAELGDSQSQIFALDARIQAEAVDRFVKRYANAAREKAQHAEGEENKKRFERMADALDVVPMNPAFDLFSALQGIWILHMITSCYSGARDYSFGRIDQYLYPYYRQDLDRGNLTVEDADTLLAFFLAKTNEICGTGTYNYKIKPIPCPSSKQYMTLGGCDETGAPLANELSYAILRAEEISNMPEPVIVSLIDEADPGFASQTYHTMSICTDKLHAYNDRLIADTLRKKGLPGNVATDYTFSGCCNIDLHYRTTRVEWFLPLPLYLNQAIGVQGDGPVPEFHSIQEVIHAMAKIGRSDMENRAALEASGQSYWRKRDIFGHVFDAMFMGECAQRCRYPYDGGTKYFLYNVYLTGIATLIDSLAAIDRLVFQEKRYTLAELVHILQTNFAHESLLQLELQKKFPKFGNDDELADQYASLAANAILDEVDSLKLPEGHVAVGGFYSLNHHHDLGAELLATADGRGAGEPMSENQSPVYGADKKGITALLQSLAKLPFYRTACGGLNLTFSSSVTPDTLRDLIESYFKLGGLHVAITTVNREDLLNAQKDPEAYRTLTVRLFGFSEYFIYLPDWQQQEIINRTQL